MQNRKYNRIGLVRNKFIRTKNSFRFIGMMVSILLLSVQCASLLPPEKRVYPKNPVKLPEGMDIHDWMAFKKKQFPNHLLADSPYGVIYKILFFRNEKTYLGSYISCTAYVRQIKENAIELIELAFMINYSDPTKPISRYNKGGELGPMNEKDRTEILLPCIEEFLEPPQDQGMQGR